MILILLVKQKAIGEPHLYGFAIAFLNFAEIDPPIPPSPHPHIKFYPRVNEVDCLLRQA